MMGAVATLSQCRDGVQAAAAGGLAREPAVFSGTHSGAHITALYDFVLAPDLT